MKNWSDYETFLKPVHLKNAERVLTITRITEEDTHPQPGKTVKSPVIWFKELPQGLILSPTNRQTLISLYGDDVQACVGKPIAVKAISVRVGGKDKQPIRIQSNRPVAPRVEPSTGEIVEPETDKENVTYQTDPSLDEVFGPNPRTPQPEAKPATPTAAPDLMLQSTPPKTEAEFIAWLQHRGWNGKEVYSALGTDAKGWLRMNAGKGWADVAQTIAATLGAK